MNPNLLPKTLALAIFAAAALSTAAQTKDDVTNYINNPSFEVNGTAGWVNDGLKSQTNTDFPKKAGNTYFEKWVNQGSSVGSASVTQDITIPPGKYTLTVGAQNFDQNNTTKECTGAVIFADDATAPVYVPNDYSVDFVCITGHVSIGFKAVNANGNWLAVDNFRLYYTGEIDPALVVAQVQPLVEEAKGLQSSMMNGAVASALAQAIAKGEAVTTQTPVADAAKIIDELKAAIANAKTSIAEYEALAAAIAEAEKAYDASKQGADALKAELDAAKQMVVDPLATSEDLANEIKDLENAVLTFNMANATGDVPEVTTHPYIARGCKIAFGRLSVDNGVETVEEGFCFSTDTKEPTILDGRASTYYEHAGKIFYMKDIKPASIYYVRAYAISKGYQVGYGDVVKVVTLPEATCTWSWERNDATDEEDARCRSAIAEAIEDYNYCSAFKGFHLSGHYVKGAGAGDGTADCSYGGWMRISQNVPYQRTGTVQHETNHGVGVGTTERWYNSKELRENTSSGYWYGPRANELIRFFENQPAGKITVTGDRTHMWVTNRPGSNVTGILNYGINGAHEDSGSKLLYYANAMLTEYLCEDGLCPTIAYPNGVPCYTFDFEPEKKYYLVSENTELGLLSAGFLRITNDANSTVKWAPTTEVNDSMAWSVEYLPESGYYRFKNVANGKYLSYSSVPIYARTEEPAAKEQFQLLPARKDVTVGEGGNAVSYRSYWISGGAMAAGNTPTNYSIVPMELGADGTGAVRRQNFKFANSDTNHRLLILSEDQIEDYQAAVKSTGSVYSATVPQAKEIEGVYSPDGMRRADTVTGVNIIRYTDGTSVKIVK